MKELIEAIEKSPVAATFSIAYLIAWILGIYWVINDFIKKDKK